LRLFRIWVSHGSGYDEFYLLEYNAVLSIVRSPVSFQFVSMLWQSQWQLAGWLPRAFLLLYNPTLPQATCVACYLLHAGFLFGWNSSNPGDADDINELHGIIYLKPLTFWDYFTRLAKVKSSSSSLLRQYDSEFKAAFTSHCKHFFCQTWGKTLSPNNLHNLFVDAIILPPLWASDFDPAVSLSFVIFLPPILPRNFQISYFCNKYLQSICSCGRTTCRINTSEARYFLIKYNETDKSEEPTTEKRCLHKCYPKNTQQNPEFWTAKKITECRWRNNRLMW
jgi:hypothetical protein